MWGYPAPLSGRLALYGSTCQPASYVGLPPPLRIHLGRCLSWFDPRAHVRPLGLYNLALASPPGITLVIKSFEKTKTLIILRAPPYSRAQLVRLGLEGGKQASLVFPIMSRAWFGMIFVPLSLLYLHYFYILVTIVMTILVFILFMLFVIMFIVYFDYMLSIASLSLILA